MFDIKKIKAFLLLLSLSLVGLSIYAQYSLGYDPCPLCIAQRTIYALLFIVFLPLLFFKNKLLLLFPLALASLNIYVASTQIYIQEVVKQDVCGGETDWITNFVYKVVDVYPAFFEPTGFCSEKAWVILGISMAGWSAIVSIFMTLLIAFVIFKKR